MRGGLGEGRRGGGIRNNGAESRVSVAPAIVGAGGLGDGWPGAWRGRPTMPRLPARRPSNEQASTLLKRGAAIGQKWSAPPDANHARGRAGGHRGKTKSRRTEGHFGR